MVSGYGIWILCLLIYNAPGKYFSFTFGTFVLENLILAFGPLFFWLLDAPLKAGVTFVSEYSIVITLRWLTILLLEFPLLCSILHFVSSLGNRALLMLRRLGESEQPRNADGTFAALNYNRPIGRPKRN